MEALTLLMRQHRFDLIYKYLYVINPSQFNRDAYVESIRAFTANTFKELEPSDGVPKLSVEDYVSSFDKLIASLQDKGFDKSLGVIPMQFNGEISDGAHRLAVCAALGKEVELEEDVVNSFIFNYEFFLDRHMESDVMDYGALEYVKLNTNSYIVNLHAATNPLHDAKVENILNKYGFVYYKKNVKMNYNGYVNLVKLSYGSFWEREKWIGDAKDSFAGARNHAKMSYGNNPMRIFVFVCDDLQKVLKAKKEIRALYNLGNNSVHINDTHEEAIWLAETYFNRNSLHFIKHCSFKYLDELFEENISYLKRKLFETQTKWDDVCCVGSTALNAYGIRKSQDMDYLSLDENFNIEDKIISPHDDQLIYYKKTKEDIITNPNNFFYYQGIKFGSLNLVLQLKKHRHEYPKDYKDILRIIFLQQFNVHLNIDATKYKIKMALKNNPIVYGFYKFIKR